MSRSIFALVLLATLAITTTAHAVPSTVGFAGRLTRTNGTTVSGPVTVVFTLYATPVGGAPVWTETRASLPASSTGLVFADLGALSPLTVASFDGDRWLEIAVAGEVFTPRLAIHAVPFALRAADADTVGGLAPEDFGDVTGVIVGAGLTGGAASGDATLAIDPTHVQRRVSGTCSDGSSISSISETGTVACAVGSGGDITSVEPGPGLSGGGTTGAVRLDADTTFMQRRVMEACAAGSAIARIGAAGGVGCEVDDDTVPIPGFGLLGTPTGDDVTLAVNTAAIQSRVTGNCAVGSSISSISATGTVTCAVDSGGDITSVTAGLGLSGGGTTGAVSLAADTTYMQRRVNGTCTAGSAVSSVSPTGAVTCAPNVSLQTCAWESVERMDLVAVVQATCPTGRRVISGGCDAAGSTDVSASRPSGAVPDGTSAVSVTGWTCSFSDLRVGHKAFALCCDL